MPPDPVHAVTLTCHRESPTDAVRSIAARVCRRPEGKLAVAYVLEGDLDRLRVPPPQPPRIGSRLWEHTCCEIFIARKGLPAYHEFNFSPSGEWAAYAFDGYRAPGPGGPETSLPVPQIAVRSGAGKACPNARRRRRRRSSGGASRPASTAMATARMAAIATLIGFSRRLFSAARPA